MPDLIFKINGADYAIDTIPGFVNSFTIDECGVYHQWTGTLIENIQEQDVSTLMVAAFMQIAYMRGNPGINPQVARKAVGDSNFADAFAAFVAAGEDDAGPPAPSSSVNAPSESPESKPGSQQYTGNDSTGSSVTPTNGQRDSGSLHLEPSATLGSARLDF